MKSGNLTLTIDTTDNTFDKLSIGDGERVLCEDRQEIVRSKHALLVHIEALLKKQRLSLSDIGSICVSTGPGSFVGTRIGITVAKTLALMLSINVNGQSPNTPIEPTYHVSKFDHASNQKIY